MYKNKHTNEIVRITKIESVSDYQNDITVYILSNGERINATSFEEHWEYIETSDDSDN